MAKQMSKLLDYLLKNSFYEEANDARNLLTKTSSYKISSFFKRVDIEDVKSALDEAEIPYVDAVGGDLDSSIIVHIDAPYSKNDIEEAFYSNDNDGINSIINERKRFFVDNEIKRKIQEDFLRKINQLYRADLEFFCEDNDLKRMCFVVYNTEEEVLANSFPPRFEITIEECDLMLS